MMNKAASPADSGVVEEFTWIGKILDGEQLLAAALSQEQGRPAWDQDGLQVKPIFVQELNRA